MFGEMNGGMMEPLRGVGRKGEGCDGEGRTGVDGDGSDGADGWGVMVPSACAGRGGVLVDGATVREMLMWDTFGTNGMTLGTIGGGEGMMGAIGTGAGTFGTGMGTLRGTGTGGVAVGGGGAVGIGVGVVVRGGVMVTDCVTDAVASHVSETVSGADPVLLADGVYLRVADGVYVATHVGETEGVEVGPHWEGRAVGGEIVQIHTPTSTDIAREDVSEGKRDVTAPAVADVPRDVPPMTAREAGRAVGETT